MKEARIAIARAAVEEYNRFLDSGEPYPNADRYATVESWTAKFGGGVEADVKVCSADDRSLFVDAVLFHNGSEVALAGDPEYQLDGKCAFEFNGEEYVVEVVAA